MKGLVKIFSLGAIALSSYTSFANDYVVMGANDQKVFAQGDNQIVMQVNDVYGDNWKRFSNYMGAKDQWIWSSSSSAKVYWYTNEGKSDLLVNFNDAEGTEYSVDIDACTDTATLVKKSVALSVLAGHFENAVELSFSGACADAGLASAWFVPDIGLVKWSHQSIIGPVSYEMASAQIAGVEYPVFNGIQVSAEFVSGRVLTNRVDRISAFLTLKNSSNQDEVFTFNSSKLFDIEIINSSGEVVNSWSANKRFLMALQTVTLQPGESKRFGGEVELRDFNGQILGVGSYKIRIALDGTNQPQASAFSAIPFAAEAPLYLDQMVTIK